jgi:hypothetical protein
MPATKNARPVTPAKKASAPRSRARQTVRVPTQRTVSLLEVEEAPVVPTLAPAYTAAPQWAPPGPGNAPAPTRPGFFGRRGVQLLLVGLVSLIVGIVIGSSANGSSKGNTNATDSAATASKPQSAPKAATTKSTAPATKAAPKPVAPAPKNAATPTKPNDKGWVVQSLTIKKDFVGAFTGSARITNTNDSSKSASFTVTLFRSGKQIGVLQGLADDMAAGKTVTVDLVSQDAFSAGSYTYDFQTDFSF